MSSIDVKSMGNTIILGAHDAQGYMNVAGGMRRKIQEWGAEKKQAPDGQKLSASARASNTLLELRSSQLGKGASFVRDGLLGSGVTVPRTGAPATRFLPRFTRRDEFACKADAEHIASLLQDNFKSVGVAGAFVGYIAMVTGVFGGAVCATVGAAGGGALDLVGIGFKKMVRGDAYSGNLTNSGANWGGYLGGAAGCLIAGTVLCVAVGAPLISGAVAWCLAPNLGLQIVRGLTDGAYACFLGASFVGLTALYKGSDALSYTGTKLKDLTTRRAPAEKTPSLDEGFEDIEAQGGSVEEHLKEVTPIEMEDTEATQPANDDTTAGLSLPAGQLAKERKAS